MMSAIATTFTFSSVSSVAYIALTANEVRVQVSFTQNFTFTDPYFDTDLTVNSQRKYVSIVDIHTQGMQWCTTLFDLFGTGNFSTTQTSADLYFDTFSTHAQCRSDSHFNGAFVVDTVFDLTGNGIPYDHGIQLGTTDFKDVDLH